jgi:hypothetical protein
MAEIVTARIALQLEPHVSKKIDPLFEETLRAYQAFRNSYTMREELRARGIGSGPELSYERTNEQAKQVDETTEGVARRNAPSARAARRTREEAVVYPG